MNSIRKWKWIIGAIILYLIIAVLSVLVIFNVPSIYLTMQKKENEKIVSELAIALKTEQNFERLKNKYLIDFIVYNKSKNNILYSTIKLEKNEILDDYINDNIVIYKGKSNYKIGNQNYEIQLMQYYMQPQDVFNQWMIIFGVAFFLLATSLVIIVLAVVLKIIKPLKKLRDNITKVSNYQLNLVNNSNDNSAVENINNQLVVFAKDLEAYLEKSEIVYSSLEKRLQIQNEKLEYKNRLIAQLAHDLKTPIINNNIIINLTKQFNSDQLVAEKLNLLVENNQKIIVNINEINKFAYESAINNIIYLEEFDLVELIKEAISSFSTQLQKKGLIIDFICDEYVLIKSYRLRYKQLIYNSLSNLVMYANDNSLAKIEAYQDKGLLKLSFYNEAPHIKEKDLANIFKLFYRIANDDIGSGTGLFTIKQISNELGLVVDFANYQAGVILVFKEIGVSKDEND